ncbi:MAG: outer membrane beta-barrel protein, partial [Bacteroidetes bacterium]|nr:outer membrane beta-barrel protein [Bacteroidota bacterium]
MRKSIIVILLLQILTFNLFSQSQPASTGEARASYGLFGHFNLNQHSADFQKLPGVPNCCPKFESGSGTGFTIGLLYELPLSDDLQLGLRLGYSSIGGELKKTEPVTIIKSGTPQAGEFEHTLNASLSNIGIEPLIGWRLFNNFTIHAGFRAGYALTGKYGQVETIVKPASGATFLDSLGNDTHSRTRNAFSGDLKDASTLYLSAIGGISYELPLNSDETLMLVPEAFYSFGLTPVVKDLKWDVSSIRAGLAIKYSPIYRIIEKQKGKEQIDTVIISSPAIAQKTFKTGMPRIETETLYSGNKKIIIENYIRTDTIINPKQYLLTASIDVLGVDSSGNEIPNPEFLVEEFISTGMHPLLNYIFFDDNSSSIPSRYLIPYL